MAMSSFLMNSAYGAEPKFPPSEEYSHPNYIQAQGGGEDYYRGGGGGNNHQYPSVYGTQGRQSYPPQDNGQYIAQAPYPPPHQQQQNMRPQIDQMQHGIGPYTPQTGSAVQGGGSPSSIPSPPSGSSMTPCTQTSPQQNPPVIYPWMKKVHNSNSGISFHTTFRAASMNYRLQ